MNKREYLDSLLALLPISYNNLYNKMYPEGPKKSQMATAKRQVENSVRGMSNSLEKHIMNEANYKSTIAEYVPKITELERLLKYTENELNEATRRIELLSADSESVAAADTAERLELLEALEQGGVDNWEWYDQSIKNYYNT